MKLAIGLLALICLAPTASSARAWSGYLVDFNCYQAEEQNVNPTETNSYVDRDKDMEIRMCSPSAKTKSFALILQDWKIIKFDSAGNAMAAESIRKIGRKSVLLVTVTGEEYKAALQVDSISISKQ